MSKGGSPSRAPFPASADRKRHSDADDEHEKRLDQVPEAKAVPRMVVKLQPDAADERAAQRRVDEMIVDLGGFSNQKKHGQPAKEVERHETLLGLYSSTEPVAEGTAAGIRCFWTV